MRTPTLEEANLISRIIRILFYLALLVGCVGPWLVSFLLLRKVDYGKKLVRNQLLIATVVAVVFFFAFYNFRRNPYNVGSGLANAETFINAIGIFSIWGIGFLVFALAKRYIIPNKNNDFGEDGGL